MNNLEEITNITKKFVELIEELYNKQEITEEIYEELVKNKRKFLQDELV